MMWRQQGRDMILVAVISMLWAQAPARASGYYTWVRYVDSREPDTVPCRTFGVREVPDLERGKLEGKGASRLINTEGRRQKTTYRRKE